MGAAFVEWWKGVRADLPFRDRDAAGRDVFTFRITGLGDEVGSIGSHASRFLRAAVSLATFDDALPFAADADG